MRAVAFAAPRTVSTRQAEGAGVWFCLVERVVVTGCRCGRGRRACRGRRVCSGGLGTGLAYSVEDTTISNKAVAAGIVAGFAQRLIHGDGSGRSHALQRQAILGTTKRSFSGFELGLRLRYWRRSRRRDVLLVPARSDGTRLFERASRCGFRVAGQRSRRSQLIVVSRARRWNNWEQRRIPMTLVGGLAFLLYPQPVGSSLITG